MYDVSARRFPDALEEQCEEREDCNILGHTGF